MDYGGIGGSGVGERKVAVLPIGVCFILLFLRDAVGPGAEHDRLHRRHVLVNVMLILQNSFLDLRVDKIGVFRLNFAAIVETLCDIFDAIITYEFMAMFRIKVGALCICP